MVLAGLRAGLSRHQIKQALRVANVPKEDFERQVESDNPPTVTALAEQGRTRGVPTYERLGLTKEAFVAGRKLSGAVRNLAGVVGMFRVTDAVRGLVGSERGTLVKQVAVIETYFDELKNLLELQEGA
jgi:hypothetical protein